MYRTFEKIVDKKEIKRINKIKGNRSGEGGRSPEGYEEEKMKIMKI